MAKIYGINNDIVGRVGNEVFERQGDANIVRGYNPHHSGTPSQAQLIQKARLDCMGNWERRLPLQAVEAFRGNKSQKWSAFVRKNIWVIGWSIYDDGHVEPQIRGAFYNADPNRLILGGEDIGMRIVPIGLSLHKAEGPYEWSFGLGRAIIEIPTLARLMIMGIPKDGNPKEVVFRYIDIMHNTLGNIFTWISPFSGIDATQFYWLYILQQINIVSVENFIRSNNWVQAFRMSEGDRTTLLSNVTFCKGQVMVGKII